jgi:hypothetical protein
MREVLMRHTAAATLGLLAHSACMAQTTYYVNNSCGDNAWSGLSPVCAAPDGPKQTIGSAVSAALEGDMVLVAPGTYPLKTNAFSMHRAITVRSSGGPFITVLDGENGEALINVWGFDTKPGILEGFTIARVDTLYPAPILLYEADVALIDCRFIDNHGWFAGAAWVEVGSPGIVTVVDCVFKGNSGAVVGVIGARGIEAIGCTFVENTGDSASSLGASDLVLTNCVFRGYKPHFGGDGPVTYCNLQGGFAGEGNIDADPMFVDVDAGDLRLLPGSPCIDAGSNPAVPEWVRTDIAGLERFVDDPATVDTGLGSPPVVDIGAHEFQAACYPDFTGDGALDLFDFLAYVNAFNAGDMDADCDRNGPLDLFDFLCFVNAFNEGC